MLIVMSRPAIFTSPNGIPFVSTVLPVWWEKVAGFQWKVGANWSVVLDEMVPAGFVLSVEDYCTAAGQKGFKSKTWAGNVLMSESCVSPRVPLALWVRTYEIGGKPRYEARLLEYGQGK